MDFTPFNSPNNYRRKDRLFPGGENSYHRYHAAQASRKRIVAQTATQRENSLTWMLLYSSLEYYSRLEKKDVTKWCELNDYFIGLHCGRATLSAYTHQIPKLDFDAPATKYPLRFGMAELVVKLELYAHTSFIGGLVARLEKYPSWRDVLRDEYSVFKIPKGLSSRVIHCPSDELKALQRSIHRSLSALLQVHESCHGFVAGKSNLSNASAHTRKPSVLRIDIRKAFESASCHMVSAGIKRAFSSLELSGTALRLLGAIVTYNNNLPTGAPTSPVLLNAILSDFDADLAEDCRKLNLVYTRYADDLIISGDIPSRLHGSIIRKLNDVGFDANIKKTKLMPRWRRQVVTGVVVNKRTNLGLEERKQLRAAVHSWTKNGKAHLDGKEVKLQVLRGHLSYAMGLNREWAEKLAAKLKTGAEE